MLTAPRVLCILLLLTPMSFAQGIPDAKLTPVPTLDNHLPIVDEGIALHEKGDFDGAIARYRAVLAENPHDTLAMYELSFALFAKGDYKGCAEVARAGAQYKSKYLPDLLTQLGSAVDKLGQPEQAVKIYKAALKKHPEHAMLHFNLAITEYNAGRFEEAKASFQRAMMYDPGRPSSHFHLADLYARSGHRIPALFASLRFLMLEPKTARSVPALEFARKILKAGVSQDPNSKNITITLNVDSKTDEGDFSSLEMMMGLLGAVAHTKENEGKSEVQQFVDTVESLLAMLAESTADKRHGGFAWNYYRPYFVEMKSRNLVEPFCYVILQSEDSPEVTAWLAKNRDRVAALDAWSRAYQVYRKR
jgi:tetratricopeptide (TPR) repeat protein